MTALTDLLIHAYHNSALFTEAWKEGVQLAGVECFGPGDLTATDYQELRPIRDVIEPYLGVMSPGQAYFMLAMYSFFNDEVAGEMAERFDAPRSVLGLTWRLDDHRRAIIARLLVHYPGW